MRLLGNVVMAFLLGLVGHFIPFEKILGRGWSNLSTHATGVLFALIPLAFLLRILGFDDEQVEKVVIAYLATYTVVGGGTFLGWLIETMAGESLHV